MWLVTQLRGRPWTRDTDGLQSADVRGKHEGLSGDRAPQTQLGDPGKPGGTVNAGE